MSQPAFNQPDAAKPDATKIAAPIGVFDSGMGGLSVVAELHRHLPRESILYYADTAHVPYGSRSDAEILALTARAVAWLFAKGCKVVVVACNTASAFSLTSLRQHYGVQLPIIGLVPALKPAVAATQTGVVAVLATAGTLRGHLLNDVIRQIAEPAGVTVLTAFSAALVPFVEHSQHHSTECEHELKRVLQPLCDAGADQLVLGCTHYPFLSAAIGRAVGDQLQLIDSGAAVARQTVRVLIEHGLLRPVHAEPACFEYAVTGDPERAALMVAQWVALPFCRVSVA